ncbi:ABC transporter permease [Rhodophyticola sp. CCM32]|uniref:ABC transporter permease n=1 Tax=Rhodophyticola sp. CCM32 TaxID=2916397 RepID=UPI001EE4EC08|nr:ABC transporter permease [Rhodophyticola sp. CCM32]
MMTAEGFGGQTGMGVRRFGRVNWLGLYTLAKREVMRFVVVWTQTLLAPLVTAGLFILIFSLAIGGQRGDVMGVSFLHFIAPGILMMTVIQNAFANTSSSIVIGKVQGNIVDTLMPPLSPLELVLGYIIGGVLRGLLVALAVTVIMFPVIGLGVAHPLWALVFVILGSAFLGALGIVAAIIAQRFDQIAAITNFIVVPLSFLSGTFYSIAALPGWLNSITHWNPVFYLIDGVRYGVLGVSDSTPWLGLGVASGATLAVMALAWRWFKTGYRLKS